MGRDPHDRWDGGIPALGFGWGPESSGDARAVSVRRKSEASWAGPGSGPPRGFITRPWAVKGNWPQRPGRGSRSFPHMRGSDLDEGPGGRAAEEDRPTTSECICLGSNHSWHQNREEWIPIRVLVSMLSKSEDDH